MSRKCCSREIPGREIQWGNTGEFALFKKSSSHDLRTVGGTMPPKTHARAEELRVVANTGLLLHTSLAMA